MTPRRTQLLIEFTSEKDDNQIQVMINRILDTYFFDVEVKNFQVSKREINRGPNES